MRILGGGNVDGGFLLVTSLLNVVAGYLMSGRMFEGIHGEIVTERYEQSALAMQVTELGSMDGNASRDCGPTTWSSRFQRMGMRIEDNDQDKSQEILPDGF